ncbi:MAG: hypothetical protein M3Y65_17000 [Pseudomonadota bacterium]|nr:hypothetical protein [Pseudomonadota bacterium]
MLWTLIRGASAAPSPARKEPVLPAREQPHESTWIRPSAAVAAGLRWRIIELENSLKEARRQVIVAEFAAHIDKTQINQLQALLARQQDNNAKDSK